MPRFQGKRVSSSWVVVLKQAEREGVKFRLNSGRRTMAEQQALYDRNMLNGRPRPGHPLTAVPNPNAPHIRVGREAHALDVDSWNDGENKLQRWLRGKGLNAQNTVPGEAWHIEVPEAQLVAYVKRLRAERSVPKNVLYAARAKKAGARYVLRIIAEAKRAGVQLSLAFALVEQESNFTNVFGHDPTIFAGAGKATKGKYLKYKKLRGPIGRGGMQGVGPCQLTWWEFQDEADREGGCWKPSCNLRVGFRALAQNIRAHGTHQGIARYNGSGAAAERYAAQVEQKQARWHRLLTGGKS